ncbi:hypothetical protein GBZ26_18725 [Azospirillum formosense]|uniref:Uncharacterized protein n=1 Tax=Azospirillum formosense TaxID=861533 RepID=A0ABX2KYR9_9PROT|nr:hypothetical protein [Azospirillum formosense]MBY3757722.1 hypothetical protein [Azospirillum formosense]NUB21220.1 hypothetical protein [Azospirillum formosense]
MQRSSGLKARDVKEFMGFLSFLIYTDLDKEFAKLIRDHWADLHTVSGPELLIIVPDTPKINTSPKIIIERKNSRSTNGNLGMLRSFDIGLPGMTAAISRELSDEWKVPLDKTPCIVFFDRPDAPEIANKLVYSFKEKHSHDEYVNFFKEIFEDCRDILRSCPHYSNANKDNIWQWRNSKMQELEQALSKRDFLHKADDLAKKVSLSSLLKLVGKLIP